MAKRKPAAKIVTREAGDYLIAGGTDPEPGTAWMMAAPRRGPFAFDWRGMGWLALILVLALALLPVLYWVGGYLAALYHRLPASWQAHLAWLWVIPGALALALLIWHPIHLILTLVGAGWEMGARIGDWRRRRKQRQDPDCFDRAAAEVAEELGLPPDADSGEEQ